MPFKSKAQMRFMFAAEERGELPKGTAKRWLKHTKNIKNLPKKKKNIKKKASSLSSFGAELPLTSPRISLEDIARLSYFRKLLALYNSPNISEADRLKLLGEFQDRINYGVSNPYIGIPSKGLFNIVAEMQGKKR